MNVPIIPGEVLITEQQPEPESLRPKLIKMAKYAGVYTLALTAYNSVTYSHLLVYEGSRDDIDMVEDASECAPFTHIEMDGATGKAITPQGFTTEEVQATIDTETSYADNVSAASNFESSKFNFGKFIGDVMSYDNHEFASFSSEYSGANIHLYSDRDDPFESYDLEAIDELMHASLDEQVQFRHIAVGQFIECARNNILLSRGGTMLEGKDLHFYIHSQPGHCFSNGHIQKFPEAEGLRFKDFCDSNGFALESLRIEFIPGLLAYDETWLITMTHRTPERGAEYNLSGNIIHEPIHIWQQLLGLPFKFNPNERLANHIEEETILQLYPEGLPKTVRLKAGAEMFTLTS